MSHPIRVRGLKLWVRNNLTRNFMSHPIRVRGLKQQICKPYRYTDNVAPYTGAWIETCQPLLLLTWQPSHPIRVRGLKLETTSSRTTQWRRTLYGCVD